MPFGTDTLVDVEQSSLGKSVQGVCLVALSVRSRTVIAFGERSQRAVFCFTPRPPLFIFRADTTIFTETLAQPPTLSPPRAPYPLEHPPSPRPACAVFLPRPGRAVGFPHGRPPSPHALRQGSVRHGLGAVPAARPRQGGCLQLQGGREEKRTRKRGGGVAKADADEQ